MTGTPILVTAGRRSRRVSSSPIAASSYSSLTILTHWSLLGSPTASMSAPKIAESNPATIQSRATWKARSSMASEPSSR